ncbi:MAG TPA: hypothetical protein DEO87_01315 [Lachnospiraceae bacterium]|nr:hypothetical protein [Lachnospiraceae bacterium]
MKRKTNKDKGFTLVELIVVLVILAILAAILVPALLGYIDRAREKQYVLNARSYLTASQAELSSIYGEGLEPSEIENRTTTVSSTADVPDCTGFVVYCGKDTVSEGSHAISTNHDAYTVKRAKYTEGTTTLYYNGSSWTKTEPTDLSNFDSYTVK